MAERPARRTPEAEHLAEQERLFSELTEQLATRETEFATLGSEFARFRARYLARSRAALRCRRSTAVTAR